VLACRPRGEDRYATWEFIAALSDAAAWPVVARAQRPDKIYRIGFIANDPAIPTQPAGQAFLDGLRQSGFIEGKNIIIERRFTEGKRERYADLAGELVNLHVDLIVLSSNEATAAVKTATGVNVAIEYRGAQSQYDRLPALAVDFVRRQVTVIVAAGTPTMLAASILPSRRS
jgi:putative ABC transport system substrate-binding protein